MKSYHPKLGSHNLLSPKMNLYNIPFSEILSSLSHQRGFSVKNSPYQSHKSTEILKTAIKGPSRYHSPKFQVVKQRQGKKKISGKVQGGLVQTKKNIKSLKDYKSVGELKIVDKNNCIYAPKLFANQIFRDVYDLVGNHDRIIESSEHSQSISCDDYLITGKLLVPKSLKKHRKKDKNCKVRPPENSYLEETKAPLDIHQEIFKRLNTLAMTQKDYSDESN